MSHEITLRYGKRERDQLNWLKKQTGLPHYHTLCRWAFAVSLADGSLPKEFHLRSEARPGGGQERGNADTAFELPWDRFGQDYAPVLMELLRRHAVEQKLDPSSETLQRLAEAHIERGLSRLMAGKRIHGIADLARLVEETRGDEDVSGNATARKDRNPTSRSLATRPRAPRQQTSQT